ncbi:hypothetical protein [Flavobacterium muglaense]|uniref:YD repeat-containing protein n=1 Tax=Flavobacterium muglaense TaxID=2764716 RepID=A0A923SF03_9FLAO|nr:hypothetical protein [Flavobacterium muglaense]MBC5837581.1 hypothetical protein [Flavobacterium muglaense]MBC5844107.1 hypothetical protein [Flavobacterium muglaense]
MKSLYITLSLILLSINSYSQIEKVEDPNIVKDIKSEELKGNVKKITVSDYKIVEKFGEATEIKTITTEITFNKDGFYLSKNVDCVADDRLVSILCDSKKKLYLYHEGSNCVSYFSCTQYDFDSYEYKTECINGLLQKITYKYNTSYRLNGEYRVFYHDKKKNLTKIEFYDKQDNISKIWQYSYNDSNKIIEKKEFDSNGNLNEKFVFGYDTKNRLIFKDTYKLRNNPLQKDSSIKYLYDIHNNLLTCYNYAYSLYKSAMESTGSISYSYKYDNNGNIVEETQSFGKSVDTKIKYYGYDGAGNWTKSVWYSSKNNPEKKVIRQIEY